MDDAVTIVVGRRGSGKSAQLYAMEAALAADKRNHVCIVKPVGYEIDGLVRVLQSILNKSERGYLVESLWKFLIYSELARSLYDIVKSRPSYLTPSEAETRFIKYYDQEEKLFTPPFSERLDIAIRALEYLKDVDDALEQRRRISEDLHSNQLRSLRGFLGAALSNCHKVNILIDNLDAPWGANAYVEHLSELLWGLLQVSDDIATDFRKENIRYASVNLNLTVFLRSDIFAFIHPTAPEQDKLPIQRITWDEPSVLKRLIDARLEFGVSGSDNAADIWGRLFALEVAGIPAWDFVMNSVLPRPRDVVYLVREAVDGAINRGHSTVEQQDFIDAREKYSWYAFKSILAEDNPRKMKLEAIVYQFAGSPQIVTRSEIAKRLNAADVTPEDHEFYIDLLCDVDFLALRAGDGYRYAIHESDREIRRGVAKQIAEQRGLSESYQVSAAFWQVLQTELIAS